MSVGDGSIRGLASWTLIAMLAILAAGAAALGSAQSHRAGAVISPQTECDPSTKFGGYYRQITRVTQISASWTVPAAGPTQGSASIWVGVQDRTGAFIQIGTDQVGFRGNNSPVYQAFWSSTALHYESNRLLHVAAGDTVDANIARAPKGWRLTFRDVTSGGSVSVITSYGKSRSFTFGDWLLEDSSGRCTIIPFPAMTMTFNDLRLNGDKPHLFFTGAAVLEAPNGVDLVPTHELDDGFSLIEPSGIRGTYLHQSAAFNIALEKYIGDVGAAHGGLTAVSAVSRTTETATIARALAVQAATAADAAESTARHLQRDLRSDHWDRRARHDALTLAQQLTAEISALKSTTADTAGTTSWTLAGLLKISKQTAVVATRLRRAIGLPPALTATAPT